MPQIQTKTQKEKHNDAQLLELTKENKEYFTKFYEKYYDKIYKYCYYKLNFNKHNTEDIVAEVFFKAIDNIDGVEVRVERKSFTLLPWLYTIARNDIINFYRKNGDNSSTKFSYNDKIDSLDKDYEEPDQVAIQKIEAGQVRKIIKEFDNDTQDIIIMKAVEEWTFREIGEQLDMSTSAAKMRYYRAMKEVTKLAKKLLNK